MRTSSKSKNSNGKAINRARQQHKRRVPSVIAQSIRGSMPGFNFESLENRQLMAVINVADYGAKPGDGQNDLPAIQAALNASQPGDTILFSGGVFDLSGFGNSGGDGLIVPSNRTYLGQNGATLRGHDTQGPQMHVTGDNVTISGLTFQDGGLKVDKGSNLNNNVVIDNNVFNLNTGGVNNNGITATSGLSNSRITNNYFTSTQGGFGILAFNWNGLTIANNEFVNISAGVHMQGFGGSTNLLFEQNYFSGMRGGMGAEIVSNSSITNCIFQDNYYENPNQGTMTHDQLLNFMAFSFPTPTCTNTIIRRNTVIAPQRPDGIGVRIGLETAGINCQVTDNYVVGCEWGITDADGTSPSSVTITGNRMSGAVNGGIRQDHAAAGRTLTQNNNGANTTLTWDINRPKPGIDSRLPGTGPGTGAISTPASPPPASPPPASPPPPPPVVTVPNAPTGLLAMATGATTVNIFWTDKSTNEGGYKVERSTDGQNWTQIASLGADAAGYTASGLTAGQNYSFRVRSFNSAGNSNYTNTATATPQAFDPKNGTYVSDLTPTSSTNYWGPAEDDMSNGQQPAGDGHALAIDGKTYAKGLGVHGGSDVQFALNGQYSSFVSDIGVDDEVSGKGSVVFQVWADGQMLYSSDTMTGGEAPQSLNVDVTGKQKLDLIVTNAGDGYDYDHADWAGAKLMPVTTTPPPVDPPVTSPTSPVYVSDLQWTSVTNGWGLPELDKSNGERGSNDGHTLTLDGIEYTKGIGAHSNSDIQYTLGGKYSMFSAAIGVDDEEGNNGSVVFQIVGDGVTLYDSGTMTGADATKFISVNVSGVKQLDLVINDAGDGKNFDHGDWANAQLTPVSTTSAVTPTGGTTYLSDMQWDNATSGWGTPELDKSNGGVGSNDGNTLTLDVNTYTKGIGTHSNSNINYTLDGSYSTFTADIGIDGEVGNNGSVVFQVIGDGKTLYDSGTMTGADPSKSISVDVRGVKKLSLVVTDGGDNINFDHADWADAKLTTAPAVIPSLGPVTTSTVSPVYVSDLQWSSVSNGWGAPELDKSNGELGSNDGNTLTLNGVQYAKGIGAHANSDIQYTLDGNYATFTSDIGVDDEEGNNGSVVFRVIGDGVTLYDSGTMTGADPTKSISVNVSGVKDLDLVINDAGDGNNFDHGDWANATLS